MELNLNSKDPGNPVFIAQAGKALGEAGWVDCRLIVAGRCMHPTTPYVLLAGGLYCFGRCQGGGSSHTQFALRSHRAHPLLEVATPIHRT